MRHFAFFGAVFEIWGIFTQTAHLPWDWPHLNAQQPREAEGACVGQ